MRVHSQDHIDEIKILRKKGYTLSQLVSKFNIPKTTIWHHIKNLKLTPRNLIILKSNQGGSKQRSLKQWELAKTEAERTIKSLTKKERMLIASALYWAEGAKGDCRLSNTDPVLIKIFLECLKEFGIFQDRLSMDLRIYQDIDPDKAKIFWSKLTGIGLHRIRSVDILQGKKNGKLLYGMARIRVVKGGYVSKLVWSIRDSVGGLLNANLPL